MFVASSRRSGKRPCDAVLCNACKPVERVLQVRDALLRLLPVRDMSESDRFYKICKAWRLRSIANGTSHGNRSADFC